MPKKRKTGLKTVQCSKCNVEFDEDKLMQHPNKMYVYKGKALCEDCLIDLGVVPDTAEPWYVYQKSITDMGKYGEGVGGV